MKPAPRCSKCERPIAEASTTFMVLVAATGDSHFCSWPCLSNYVAHIDKRVMDARDAEESE